MKSTILYQKSKTGKTLEWKIWVVEKGASGYPEVYVEHGQQSGKKQTTFDVVKSGVNEGKANATTPYEQALLVMERKITKQREQGYTEEEPQDLADDGAIDIDFSKPFAKSLCFFKPKTSIEEKKLAELEKKNRAIFSIKRDGLMNVAVSSDFDTTIYSRRMDIVSGKFPHLIEALKGLPKRTILLGEIIFEKAGRDDFKTCCSICRSDDDVAIAKQNTFGKVHYYVFDLAYLDGKNLLTTTPFKKRRELLLPLIKKLGSKWVVPSEVISKSHENAMKEVKQRGLEGLVIYDADGIMAANEAFSMTGKPRRPNMLWKSKFKMETDVVVKWNPEEGVGEYGNGKLKGLFGNGLMYQLDGDKEVFLGKVGGGLSEEQRKFYTSKSLFPRAWAVEFDSPQSSGKLRFPVFKADRTLAGDKDITECDLDERIKAAMEESEEEE